MYKIALVGKANTGKNTTATLLDMWLEDHGRNTKLMAFADPIKEIVRTMFPFIKRKWLYGPSKFRSNIIEGALDADGNPLTIRKSLLDVGTRGREYCSTMWLDIFSRRFNKQVENKTGLVIVTDARFRNEFDFLKQKGFYMIRVNRSTEVKINHISETGQDAIQDSEFDFIIDNNAGLDELNHLIKNTVVPDIKNHQG